MSRYLLTGSCSNTPQPNISKNVSVSVVIASILALRSVNGSIGSITVACFGSVGVSITGVGLGIATVIGRGSSFMTGSGLGFRYVLVCVFLQEILELSLRI